MMIASRAIRLTIFTAMLLFCACSEQPDRTAAAPASSTRTSDHAPAAAPWFENVTDHSNVDVVHLAGTTGEYWIPEITIGGVAVFDADNDGDLDLYFIQGNRLNADPDPDIVNRFYENVGDFQFVDRTAESGLGHAGYGCGVAVGDFDNDGDADVYVTNLGSNALFRNNGDGTFTNIAEEAGVAHEGFSACAAFADLDRDGFPDLIVTNYLDWTPAIERPCFNPLNRRDYCMPEVYKAPAADVIYRNNGDGTFTDVSMESGIAALRGTGLGVVSGDFNADGLPDIFVANDGMPDRLWINQGGLRFSDEGMLRGAAVDTSGQPKAGMGVAVSDIDQDGLLDLLVGNLVSETDSLFLNSDGYFIDLTSRYGLAARSRSYTRWGIGLHDFDNDGVLDLYQANGRVAWAEHQHAEDIYAEPNLLLKGRSDQRFDVVQPAGGTAEELIHSSRGAAFGDLNNDGGVDIVVVNRDAQPYVLRNVVEDRGNWMILDIRNRHGSPAIGASVIATVEGQPRHYDVRSAYSYLASNDPRVHMGLGDAEVIDKLVIEWVDGTTSEYGPIDTVNQIITFQQPQ